MYRKLIVLVVFVAAVAAVAVFARRQMSIEQLAVQELRLRALIAARPWTSFAVGLAVYSVVSLVPGTTGKSIIFGWLFGFWRGVLIVVTGLTVAGMATFATSRYLLREIVEAKMTAFVNLLNRTLERNGPWYLLTLRLAHVPFSWINYGSGASRIDAWTFCWTTAAGLLPGTMVFVYVGTQLPTLRELGTRGVEQLIDPSLLAALLLTAAFPLTMRWLIRWCARWVRQVRGETKAGAAKAPDSDPRGART